MPACGDGSSYGARPRTCCDTCNGIFARACSAAAEDATKTRPDHARTGEEDETRAKRKTTTLRTEKPGRKPNWRVRSSELWVELAGVAARQRRHRRRRRNGNGGRI